MKPLILTRQSGFRSQPAVRKAMSVLRPECISRAPGTLLGQEEDLLQRFGFSRPTLRQAAALLSQEQLMEVRRGPGGGYFTARPDVSAVVHMAAIWLQLENASLRDILVTTSTIRPGMAALAATNMDDEARAELEAFLAADRAIRDGDYTIKTFLRAERKQNALIGAASGNQVLNLYMQISLDLVGSLSPEDDILSGHDARMLEWRRLRNNMLDAVLAGDPDIARLQSERCGAKMLEWLKFDAAKKAGDEKVARG